MSSNVLNIFFIFSYIVVVNPVAAVADIIQIPGRTDQRSESSFCDISSRIQRMVRQPDFDNCFRIDLDTVVEDFFPDDVVETHLFCDVQDVADPVFFQFRVVTLTSFIECLTTFHKCQQMSSNFDKIQTMSNNIYECEQIY